MVFYTILTSFFSFFLTIDSYFFIATVIAQMCNSTAELTMFIEIPTKETTAETARHPLTAEAKVSKYSI